MADFRTELKKRILVLDGAMGTELMKLGMGKGACPDELNLSKPEWIEQIHRSYVEAGADIIVTNTFGANRLKLDDYGLGEKLVEINAAAVAIARRSGGEKPIFVAGSLGPSGRFIEPVGDLDFDEACGVFREQAAALIEAHVDLITCETFLDLRELKAAVIGARMADPNIPLIAMMTFDETLRTVLGTSPEAAAVTLDALGVDVIGTNCGLGIDMITEILARMRSVTARPLISQPNAGLPTLVDGETHFPHCAHDMTPYIPRNIELGVRIVAGCCGTTPEHIRAMGEKAREVFSKKGDHQGSPLQESYNSKTTFAASRTDSVAIGAGRPTQIVGERINPTGKKAYSAELKEGKISYIRAEAVNQTRLGAHLLDVNVGVPFIDEPGMMRKAVFTVNGASNLPIVIDSSSPEAMEAGLKAVDGKPVINSVNGEEKSLATILPLAKKYGAAVIGLVLDEKGIPSTVEGRFAIAKRIVERAESYGIRRSDVIIDAITLTASAKQEEVLIATGTIRRVTAELGCSTILGVSNVSFGLPERKYINLAFLSMAMEAGLSLAISNPNDEIFVSTLRAANVLTGMDENAAAYIDKFRTNAPPAQARQAPGAEKPDIYEQIKRAVIGGEKEKIVALTLEALDGGMSPLSVINDGLIPGLEVVGGYFERKEYFLPQMIQSAKTMQLAFEVIKPLLKKKDGEAAAKILVATVEGDIHDIGKNIAATVLESYGFDVIDLGKSVPADRIVAEAKRLKVDFVGLSALMTTTMGGMKTTIARLRAEGIMTATIVGGAVVTQEYASEIGADIYAPDAMSAVKRIKSYVEARKK